MHLFSTCSWHISHWDPVITFVFPEFLFTYYLLVWNCGVWWFALSLGFSLYLFCSITTLVSYIVTLYHCCRPSKHQISVTWHILGSDVLFRQTASWLQYCSCKRSTPWVQNSTRLKVAVVKARVTCSLTALISLSTWARVGSLCLGVSWLNMFWLKLERFVHFSLCSLSNHGVLWWVCHKLPLCSINIHMFV